MKRFSLQILGNFFQGKRREAQRGHGTSGDKHIRYEVEFPRPHILPKSSYVDTIAFLTCRHDRIFHFFAKGCNYDDRDLKIFLTSSIETLDNSVIFKLGPSVSAKSCAAARR